MAFLQRVRSVGRGAVRVPQRVWAARYRDSFRMALAVVAVLAAIVMLTPGRWWRPAGQLLAGPGWRWMPILLLLAGLAVLLRVAALRWGGRGGTRRRPTAVRAPLFAHVGVLLLTALAVAVTVGVGLWLAFGRPDLVSPVTASPARTAPPSLPAPAGTAPTTGWTVPNTFEAMKIVLSVVAGIGGVVALTVAYRKQGHSEAAEHREDTKLFNERFGKAADQLGSDKAAVRLAGVYAMAGLADDWAEGRQSCIDVLCAYLRMPYTPPPPTPTSPAAAHGPGLPLNTPVPDAGDEARQEQQVRHTVMALIGDHLRPPRNKVRERWHGHRFDFTGAVFDGGNLHSIDITTDTVLDFSGATFSGGLLDFSGATFLGGTVDFSGATLPGGGIDFFGATLSSGTVNFFRATLAGGTVSFNRATLHGGMVAFFDATLSGGTVAFSGATLSGGMVNFSGSTLSGGMVNFFDATLSDGEVDFSRATLSGSTVNFFDATLSGGTVDFSDAMIDDGEVDFAGAGFSGSEVHFCRASFSGGMVNLQRPGTWVRPPLYVDGSERGVLWPSPDYLAGLKVDKSSG